MGRNHEDRHSPIVRLSTLVPNPVAGNTPEDHVDDEHNKSAEGGKCRGERHEDSSDARVSGATQAKNDREASKASCHRVKNHNVGKVADYSGVQTVVAAQKVSRRSAGEYRGLT